MLGIIATIRVFSSYINVKTQNGRGQIMALHQSWVQNFFWFKTRHDVLDLLSPGEEISSPH